MEGVFLHQWCNFSVRIPGCAAQPDMEDPMVCKHKFIRFHKDLCTWEAKTQFFWTWFNYSQQQQRSTNDTDHSFFVFLGEVQTLKSMAVHGPCEFWARAQSSCRVRSPIHTSGRDMYALQWPADVINYHLGMVYTTHKMLIEGGWCLLLFYPTFFKRLDIFFVDFSIGYCHVCHGKGFQKRRARRVNSARRLGFTARCALRL